MKKLFAYAFILNFAWEVAHSPLYVPNIALNFLLCLFLAAVADALIIAALLYFLRRPAYFIPAALAIAVAVEKAALWYGLWSYAPAMPVVPILEVGLTPFVQLAAAGYIARLLARKN
jgi:hypothetical protein